MWRGVEGCEGGKTMAVAVGAEETAGCEVAFEDPASWHGESDDLLAIFLSTPPLMSKSV